MSKKKIIVKIQAAQFPWHQSFMTYNEDKSIMFESPFSEQFYIEQMKSREKVYFYATVEEYRGTSAEGLLLGEEAPVQDW